MYSDILEFLFISFEAVYAAKKQEAEHERLKNRSRVCCLSQTRSSNVSSGQKLSSS